MSEDLERWQILVNTVAGAWNNGLVPGLNQEAFEWARREILNHADAPAVRSDELIALGDAVDELAEARETIARLEGDNRVLTKQAMKAECEETDRAERAEAEVKRLRDIADQINRYAGLGLNGWDGGDSQLALQQIANLSQAVLKEQQR